MNNYYHGFTMNHKILKIISPVLIMIFMWGCSDIRNDLTQPKELNIHEEGIANTASPNFHAAKFGEDNWNVESCQQCHGSNYSGGTVEVSCNTCHSNPGGPEACNTCHGDFSNISRIAPPTDLNNNIATTQKGVGAHASHIYDNQLAGQASCFVCHPNQSVPNKSYVSSHIDGLPAEISIAGYSFTANTCSNTYCHGNFTFQKNESQNNFGYISNNISGNNFTPLWTKVDGTQAVCGSCHGLPPTGHIASDINECFTCHIGVVDASGRIIDPLKHINGEIQLADESYFADADCNNCHGNTDTQPFAGVGGVTVKSDRGVALHDEHLFLNSIAAEINCESCHNIPQVYNSSGHFDASSGAELVFWKQESATNSPVYTHDNLQCSNTYCHGNFSFAKNASSNKWGYINGNITGKSATVTWQSTSASVGCTSCHGLPPAGHIAVDPNSCKTCHNGVADYSHGIFDPSTHIDGNIQLAGSDFLNDAACDNCHGNTEIQPFYGVAGATLKSDRGVALHDEHLFSNSLSEISCNDCHTVPERIDSEGHFDNTTKAEVKLWQQSGTNNTPAYSQNSLQCSNSYCHGNFKYEKSGSDYAWAYSASEITGNSKSVMWQSPANNVVCGSCHGLPPTGHVAAELTECANCHSGVVDGNGNIIDKTKHINGVANVFGN